MCSSANSVLGKFLLLPHADVILRSSDSHDFAVQQLYVINSSPVLGAQIMATPPEATVNGETSLPVIRLPENHTIISSLLSFLFPVPPILPPSREQTLELLAVAQKYRMTTVLTRIRDYSDTRQPELQFRTRKCALREYSLAWKYGLFDEVLRAARATIKWPMTLNVFDDESNVIPHDALVELWKYRRRVLDDLSLSLATENYWQNSDAYKMSAALNCEAMSKSSIPRWLSNHLDSVAKDLACLDITAFHFVLSSHISSQGWSNDCNCKSISCEAIRDFWTAFTDFFNKCLTRAELNFSLAPRETPYQKSTLATTGASPLQKGLNMQGADVILQSSDLISFCVHKSILAISSPFFNDLFSLPRPPDDEAMDGLPVVRVSEDAEVLHSLLTLLYPIPSVMSTYEKTLALLAASEKYCMDTVSSTVRSRIALPTPEAALRAYAIASSKGLIPEMEATARLTFDLPMTLEVILDILPLFEGSALHNLLDFRERCRVNLLSFFVSFLDSDDNLSTGWNQCYRTNYRTNGRCPIARWFHDLVSQHINNLLEPYTSCSFPKSSTLRKEYDEALGSHISEVKCSPCSMLYSTVTHRDNWLHKVTEARDKEPFFQT